MNSKFSLTIDLQIMFGLLNVNKPAGMTSRDVVNRVQRIVRPEKVGHAGTLDPLATGVLVLCLGQATRLIQLIQAMPKRYTGTFLLGRCSNTEDIQGDVAVLEDPPWPSHEQIEMAAPQFIGEIQQRPPAFSALKIEGRRAYQLARSGQTVQLEPRRVTIHELNIVDYDYPTLTLDIVCGSGTYVRSLGRDLAESLGTAAVMSSLVRTAVGDFRIEDACELDALNADTIAEFLIPANAAVARLPSVELSNEEAERIAHGLTIPNRTQTAGQHIAAFDSSGRLLAIVSSSSGRRLKPLKNFRPELAGRQAQTNRK